MQRTDYRLASEHLVWACTLPMWVTEEAQCSIPNTQIDAHVAQHVWDLLGPVLADGEYHAVRLGPLCRQRTFKPLAAGSILEFPLLVYWREVEWRA